jgi:hypothetical protein
MDLTMIEIEYSVKGRRLESGVSLVRIDPGYHGGSSAP